MALEDSKVVVTKKVSVFLEDIDLMIREADVTQLTLDYPSNLSTFLQIEQGDEQFSIKQVKPRPKQNFRFLNLVTDKVPDFLLPKLTLLVPKGLTLTNLAIHLVSSDGDIESLAVKTCQLTLTNGNVKARAISAEQLSGFLVNGDISFSNCHFQDLKLELNNGDMSWQESQSANTHLICYNGDIGMTNGTCSDRLIIDNQNGDTHINQSQLCQVEMRLANGDVALENSNFERMLLEMASGNADVRLLPQDQTEVTIDVTTDFGSCHIFGQQSTSCHYYREGTHPRQLLITNAFGNITLS
ncbi:DUF4097 family beta strand repeat-containing protein [Streptococcus dysgalactiae]|nr:DUF4097 family beta strand repeat-containing protein [Streptococcus dysgalactiae]